VVGDSLVKQDEKTHVISIGGEKGGTSINIANTDGTKRTLSGVHDGTVSKTSSDAVNGSQLYSMNKTVATYFGGGAGYDDDGKWTAPTFKVKTVKEDGKDEEKSYDNVADALAGVGTSFTNIHNEINKEINKVVSDSLVKQDDETHVISIGGKKGGTSINIANSDNAARTLSGVKEGDVSKVSTDAVNGSQLYSMNKMFAEYFGGGAGYDDDGKWSVPSFKLKTVNSDGKDEEKSYGNVADALAGVGTSFTNIHKEINKVVGDSLVKQDEKTHVISIGGEKSGTSITLSNIDGAERTLSGVRGGAISETSTDAVNGSQLYSMSNVLASYLGGGAGYKDGKWSAPEFKVAQFKSDGSSDEKTSYDNVAAAFDGVNTGMTNINNRIHDVEKNVASNGLNWNETEGAYDAKHDDKSSKIKNVLAGKVEENSQEVVNGGQLWETNEKVKEVEKKVDTIDQHVKDITTTVMDGAVKYDKDDDGKKTNKVTLVGGNDSEPVMIDNVADGKIETGSQQAVNGGQLHDYTEEQMKIVLEDANKYTDEKVSHIVKDGVNEANSYTDMKFETLNYAIEDVRKEARQAAAIGLAVSNLRYYDIPGSLSVSFGSGLWRSQSAFAIGAGYTSEDGNIRSNVSVTSAGGHWGIGAGITLRLR
uniref:Vomp family autotransporter n=1 Tax=Bartonella sp. CB15SXKL TaxID=3243512 RepID=UPI0035CF5F0B